jgi:LysR family hydrogen peroxide-inducible transcriptional activator
MTLNELRYLVTLAEVKHFGHAAKQCFVSQPTLSVAIKKLEEKLGVILFERRNQQIDLTPAGALIVEKAKKVLSEMDSLEQLAKHVQDPLHGELRVGAIYTIAPYLLPLIIPELHRLAPQMPLYIQENFTASLRQELVDGKMDAAIIALPFTGTDLVTRPLYKEEFVALLPAQHPLAKKDAVTQQELAEESLLLLGEGHCVRDQILQTCPAIMDAAHNPEGMVRSMVSGSSLETLKHMVASGMGVTILPESAARVNQYKEDTLVVRPFADTPPSRTVALAWRASFPRPKAMELLARVIRDSH